MKSLLILCSLLMLGSACSSKSPRDEYESDLVEARQEYDEDLREAEEEYQEKQED